MTRTEKISNFLMKVYAWYIFDSRKHYFHRWQTRGFERDFKRYMHYLKKSLSLHEKGY